jgi:hypothetical protein
MMGAPAPNPNYTVPKQEQTESFSQDDLERVRNEERDRLKAEMAEKRNPRARKPRTQNNMPTFGDPEILKKLDEIAEEEKKQRAEKTGTAKRGRKSKDQE